MSQSYAFKMMNLDRKMAELETPPIILNNLPLETEDDRKYIEALCITNYTTTDVMATVPSCVCKKWQGGPKLGHVCPHCHTRVESHHSQKITSDVWVEAPEGIPYLMAPLVWGILSTKLKARHWNGLEWAMDPTYPDPEERNRKGTQIFNKFTRMGLRRGMANLEQELDKIVDVAASLTQVARRQELLEFLDTYHDCILVKHLPIPSRVAFVVEDTPYAKYYDKTMSSAMEAIFSSVGVEGCGMSVRRLEHRFTTVMSNLCKYYSATAEKTIAGKPGWMRRVNYGRRMNATMRCIATSEHSIHDYRTCRAPYHQVLTCIRPVVVSHLMTKYGHTWRQARAYVLQHATDCDPFLWSVLEEIIDDTNPAPPNRALTYVTRDDHGVPILAKAPSPLKTRELTGGGIWVSITRYPSLARTSTTGFRVVGLTRDMLTYSVGSLTGPNLDYDYREL